MYQFIENDAEIIFEGKKLRFDTTEGVQRAEAYIRMKEVVDKVTGLKIPRTKVSFCYNSLTPKAPSEPFVIPCLEGSRTRKKRGENIMTHCVMRFPEEICVPIPVRTQATRTVKSDRPITAKIALEIGKKWVKQTYGNIDFMCGIHIDQPDMLLHFLLYIKEPEEKGEEVAKEILRTYKIGSYLPEIEEEPMEETEEERGPILIKEEPEKPRDVESVVARVRASLQEESKTEENLIQPTEEDNSYDMKPRKSFVSEVMGEYGTYESRGSSTIEISVRKQEEKEPEKIIQKRVNADIIDKVPVVGDDPLEQIKKNAMMFFNQMKDPEDSSNREVEQVEQAASKNEDSVKDLEEKEEQKSQEPENSAEKLFVGKGDFLSRLGKTEDEMLYDESEYAKAPVGEVVWGAGASKPNLFAELPPEEKIPSVRFFVQNEKGERETPEEFEFEPTPIELAQQNAAASYVSQRRIAKIKKIGVRAGIALGIALLVFLIIMLIK